MLAEKRLLEYWPIGRRNGGHWVCTLAAVGAIWIISTRMSWRRHRSPVDWTMSTCHCLESRDKGRWVLHVHAFYKRWGHCTVHNIWASSNQDLGWRNAIASHGDLEQRTELAKKCHTSSAVAYSSVCVTDHIFCLTVAMLAQWHVQSRAWGAWAGLGPPRQPWN